MISFRFHVVSITAVFLAIAIGVVVGIDLRRRGRRRRPGEPDRHGRGRTSTSRKAENDRLESELRTRAAYIDASAGLRGHRPAHRRARAPRGRAGRRRGRGPATVALLASRAGGRRPGHRVARARWALETTRTSAALADDHRGSTPTTTARTLQRSAWEAVAAELAGTGRGPATAAAEPIRRSLELGRGRLPLRRRARRRRHRRSTTWPAPSPGCSSSRGARARRRSSRPSCPVVVEAARRRPGVATVVADVHVGGAGGARPRRGAGRLALGRTCASVSRSSTTPTAAEGQVAAVLALAPCADGVGRALRLRRRRRTASCRRGRRREPRRRTAPRTSVTRSVAGMGAAAAVSRAFGGLRMVVIAAVLGTTYLGNTFQAVQQRLQRALRAARRGRAVRRARADLRRPASTAATSGAPRRSPAACCRSRWSGSGRGLARSASLLAPQLAALLTTGVDDPAIAAAAGGAGHLPAPVLHPPGAALRAGRGGHRGAARPRVVRAPGHRPRSATPSCSWSPARLPGDGRHRPGPRPLRRASGCAWPSAARSAWPPSSASRPSGCARSGFRFRLGARRAVRDADVRRVLGLSGWAALQHAGTGSCWPRPSSSAAASRAASSPTSSPWSCSSLPTASSPSRSTPPSCPACRRDAAAGDREGLHAVDALGGSTPWPWPRPRGRRAGRPVGAGHGVLAFGEAAEGDGPSSSAPRCSAWRSASRPTAASCC